MLQHTYMPYNQGQFLFHLNIILACLSPSILIKLIHILDTQTFSVSELCHRLLNTHKHKHMRDTSVCSYLEPFGSVDGSQRSEHPEDSEDLHYRDRTGAKERERDNGVKIKLLRAVAVIFSQQRAAHTHTHN